MAADVIKADSGLASGARNAMQDPEGVDLGRRVLSKRLLLGTLLLQSWRAAGAEPSDSEEADTQALRESWMEQWMTRPPPPEGAKVPVGPLVLSRFVEPMYFLVKPIGWKPSGDRGRNLAPVEAPAGFVCDLASIPRTFWSLLRPDGEYVYAAILHDYMYWTQIGSREDADDTFQLAMQEFDVWPSVAAAIYHGTRIFGQNAWDRNRELAKNGEKRLLKRFPTDPRTRWSDWKKDPDVFA
jgi:hypothetical protein